MNMSDNVRHIYLLRFYGFHICNDLKIANIALRNMSAGLEYSDLG